MIIINFQANSFRQMASFHLPYETHGGEDVSVYAIGPQVYSLTFQGLFYHMDQLFCLQAHLVTGVHEQSYLAHLAAYAGCLQRDSLGCPTSGANKQVRLALKIVWFSINDFVILCKL